MLNPQFLLPIASELVIDLFAGGGGASTGIEQAIGRHVDIAINHDPEAVSLHQANHPQTLHYVSDVFEVDPLAVTEGRRVGLLWASPDCKHFSKAKGGKPVSKKIRSLAWVVVKWAKLVKPRIIKLENVEEFQTWGPLGADDRPCPERKGRTFKRWKRSLEQLGYVVEHRELRACDYGAPTIRKRLFLIARCDGQPIVWPAATHGAPDSLGVRTKKLKPYRTAADCIDWSVQAPSIFERQRPLADATNRRIAKGIMRYVVNAEKPFIVPLTHQGSDRVEPIDQPMNTVTGAHRGEKALVVPTLVQTGYGEREGQAPRALDIGKPLGTIVGSEKHALVEAFIAKHYNGVVGSDLNDPMATVTSVDHNSLVTATMVTNTTGHPGAPVDEPVSTITTGGQQALVTAFLTEHANASNQRVMPADEPLRTQVAQVKGGHFSVVAANLVHMGHGEQSADGAKRWSHGVRDVEQPLNTVTASGVPAGLVTANLVHYHADKRPEDVRASDLREPLKTQTTENRHALVKAFLIKYYGTDQDPALLDPLHTVTTKDRFGLVMVKGEPYQIVDIGLRMLMPRELYRAQGFPDSYRIDTGADGKPLTKTAQVRMCGNSVCPPVACALVAANFSDILLERRAA